MDLVGKMKRAGSTVSKCFLPFLMVPLLCRWVLGLLDGEGGF